jgi:hypothetical protein
LPLWEFHCNSVANHRVESETMKNDKGSPVVNLKEALEGEVLGDVVGSSSSEKVRVCMFGRRRNGAAGGSSCNLGRYRKMHMIDES